LLSLSHGFTFTDIVISSPQIPIDRVRGESKALSLPRAFLDQVVKEHVPPRSPCLPPSVYPLVELLRAKRWLALGKKSKVLAVPLNYALNFLRRQNVIGVFDDILDPRLRQPAVVLSNLRILVSPTNRTVRCGVQNSVVVKRSVITFSNLVGRIADDVDDVPD